MATRVEKMENTRPSRIAVILYSIAAVVALTGLAEATYLTVLSLTGATALCGDSAGCFQVLGSKYARIAGFPVAGLGALAYFTVFSMAVFAAFGHRRARHPFAITIWAMFAGTLALLYVQAFVLHAYCRYCLVSAALVFLLAGIAVAKPPSE
jgi:uncharacterized membrane protein